MSDFLFPIIEIVLGVVLLFAGGEFFIQGAIFLSLILGIPQIVIGLTVVSLGTSSPELLVSLSSILKGSDWCKAVYHESGYFLFKGTYLF